MGGRDAFRPELIKPVIDLGMIGDILYTSVTHPNLKPSLPFPPEFTPTSYPMQPMPLHTPHVYYHPVYSSEFSQHAPQSIFHAPNPKAYTPIMLHHLTLPHIH